MDTFKYDTLKNMLGQAVSIEDAAQGVKIDSTIATVAAGKMHGDQWEAFAVILKANPDAPRLHQGTYRIANPDIGDGELFVSPKSASEYEIIVSRKLENS